MRALAFLLVATPALAQPVPHGADPWPTILSLRGRLVEIYGSDRGRCLAAKDEASEACRKARDELAIVQQVDAQIAATQREVAAMQQGQRR